MGAEEAEDADAVVQPLAPLPTAATAERQPMSDKTHIHGSMLTLPPRTKRRAAAAAATLASSSPVADCFADSRRHCLGEI